MTRWGRDLDPDNPWPEHPRPQLVRDAWSTLNGWWDFAVRRSDEPAPASPEEYDGAIVVPFSPETALSRSGREGRPLQPDETLHYRRRVVVPQHVHRGDSRLLLHFGAVDQSCVVRVDGVEVGRHDGGFWPFTIDVSEAFVRGFGELTVSVTDPTDTGPGARGKQRLEPGEIWYPAQSGIWQTVWFEAVPAVHVTGVDFEPVVDSGDPDRTRVRVTVRSNASATAVVRVGESTVRVETGSPVDVPLPHARLWSPHDPFCYDVLVHLEDDKGRTVDEVRSYLGMRSIEVRPPAGEPGGVPTFWLNGRAQPMIGVLDQGYWPDGLLTPPSDDALVHDLETVRDLGFTMLRKHVKIEPLRFYHHCDRLGLLVWQDLVNGGGRYRSSVTQLPGIRPVRLRDRGPRMRAVFGRADADGREVFERDLARTVALLGSSPSVVVWVLFNEGWGQYDTRRLTGRLRALDPTRPIVPVSGWHDQGGDGPAEHGEVRSLHVYGKPVRVNARMARAERERGRALAIGEYGGLHLPVDGHRVDGEVFGYQAVEDADELAAELARLERDELGPARRAGVAASVYTQLTDVAGELNGLLTWDREVRKVERYPFARQ
ncbi:glycoside hydrolase family 2 protein [Nocardioides massiliensis]|nr:glycoside hydrolase family 2 TIM barrel-domain containing protein [Nocardioides massiliensis]